MKPATDRELRITHTFKASTERMWEAWTHPEQLVNWWGPTGFTTTIQELDLRESGAWNLILHGPDGTNYPNRSIFLEIVPLAKIVFEHFNPHFITTVLFTASGEETHLDWTLLFDTPAQRDTIVKVHKAEEGQQQNIERLERYLANLPG